MEKYTSNSVSLLSDIFGYMLLKRPKKDPTNLQQTILPKIIVVTKLSILKTMKFSKFM